MKTIRSPPPISTSDAHFSGAVGWHHDIKLHQEIVRRSIRCGGPVSGNGFDILNEVTHMTGAIGTRSDPTSDDAENTNRLGHGERIILLVIDIATNLIFQFFMLIRPYRIVYEDNKLRNDRKRCGQELVTFDSRFVVFEEVLHKSICIVRTAILQVYSFCQRHDSDFTYTHTH